MWDKIMSFWLCRLFREIRGGCERSKSKPLIRLVRCQLYIIKTLNDSAKPRRSALPFGDSLSRHTKTEMRPPNHQMNNELAFRTGVGGYFFEERRHIIHMTCTSAVDGVKKTNTKSPLKKTMRPGRTRQTKIRPFRDALADGSPFLFYIQ